ncbi:Nucleolar complex protein 3-like protein [Harpegnathos saltator]|uniref:NOC3-like protein n=1 Tax=Harpegnathos saltator TaxID=610380 RepID=E2BNG6_HARSA|nr:Nucleolar complex protein 3-like protein [Harpegnathos saltator]
MGKLRKLKVSKVKRNNHVKTKLSKQGKLKSKRHTSKKQSQKPPPPRQETVEEEESDHGEDLMDMVEKDDLIFLQEAISNKSYNLLKQIHLNEPDKEQNGRKRKKIENSRPIEELFENNFSKIMKDNAGKSIRMLLPIKTKNGLIQKHIIEEVNDISNKDNEIVNNNNEEEESKKTDKENNSDMEMEINAHNTLEKADKPVSTIELLACREEVLKSKRFKIGILSSGILENPELNISNFKMLLDFMDERNPEIYITVRKLTMVSLLEIFKDLLPSYNILQISQEGVKLKNETLALQNYETILLRSYNSYLQRLEKMLKILRRKRGDARPVNEREAKLGETAVSCMCELLIVHPYFNFSVNIANYILPFLDNKRSSVRGRIMQCISQIFKEDKRGELSLTIVRKLNQYIKAKKHSVYPEVITVLLSLRIKDVNLDKEKEEETKQKKLMSRKQRILALSRRERKKNKKLEQVEKELLETKAEENKQAKQKMLTEITSIIFTIYFRILKQAPNSKVLSACLEGLAKFAHCINIDFYQDLVGAIDRLIEEVKKETLALQNYETILLRSYKSYLQRLEKMSKILRRKRGDARPVNEREAKLGETAVSCMCELLIVHPYFNFSVNIANYILPFLDNKRSSVRGRIMQCISQIFKEDKRGELSLTIVRKLNQYIKAKKHSVYPEVITVLLSLRIKDVNLDKEKEEETKQKKLMSRKQRILALSRRERKKNKKLEQVEKELLETKAEENKQAKQKMLTEITSIIFTIYFRILKQAPNSKVLSACLEGLAKFAHCINIDFYQDLVGAIDRLIEEGNLGLREQLHCVQCIFTILSGQGTALNIDPYRFYAHLYKNLLNVHCGKTHAESEIIQKTLIQVLIHQRKKITQARAVAFVKRISTWALQSQHNVTLGILGIVKQVMQLGKAAHGLLDTDCTGNGHYQSEILEPDYCNAYCTALWEIVALQRHYHSVVQQLAKNIAYAVPTSGEGSMSTEIAKLTPDELYTEYDPAGVAFKPSVPIPRNIKKTSINNNYVSNNLEQYLNAVDINDLFAGEHVDFYEAFKSNS